MMSSFGKNVLTIGTGNVIAQVISLGAIPIITRLFTPTEYGAFAIYLAIATTVFPLATLRYSAAILLPESDDDVTNLAALALFMAVITACSAFVFLSVAQAAQLLPESWESMKVSSLLWVIPLGLLIQGVGEVAAALALRSKNFGDSALARILESVIDRGLVLITGLMLTATAAVLVAGRTIGPLFGNLLLLRSVRKKYPQQNLRALARPRMIALGKRYKDFALIATWASLFDSASRQVPILLMSLFFPASVAGQYMLAMQVINLPMMIVGDAIANVFLQRCAQNRNDLVWLGTTALKLLEYLLLLSVPFVLVMTFLGRAIFATIFGAQWETAGLFLQILAISFLLMFLHRPFSALFDVMERQRARVIFDGVLFFGRVLVILIAGFTHQSPSTALIGIVIVTVVVYASGLVYLFGLIRVPARRLADVISCTIRSYVPLAIALPMIAYQELGNILTLILGVGVLVIQAAIIFRNQPDLLRELARTTGLGSNPS
jgi:lipopolysaccharide exporter